MAKNILKKQELNDDFDFSDEMESSYEPNPMADVANSLIESSNHQMLIAFELTKFIVEKTFSGNMKEEQILACFKRASKTVTENFPMKGLWEQLGS